MAAALWLALANGAQAQPFPAKAIRVVVPFPPGGSSDYTARLALQRLPEILGRPVVFDNRGGAAGLIGAQAVANAPADGYTLLISNNGMLTVAPHISQLPYDPIRDFVPISNLIGGPQWLVLHSSVPAKNVKELIVLAKAKPAVLAYGSAGVGLGTHLSSELFKTMADIDILHVPYKGTGPMAIAFLGGEISMLFTGEGPTMLPHVKAGRVRMLAVTSLGRSPATPDVPTMDESGLKGFEYVGWNGILAPAGVPREVLARISRDILKSVQAPEVSEHATERGMVVIGSSSERFAAQIRAESDKWGRLLKQIGLSR